MEFQYGFSNPVTVPNDRCNNGFQPCNGGPNVSSNDMMSNLNAKLRGSVDITDTSCLPNAKKVKLQQLQTDGAMPTVELQVTSYGVNVAEGAAVERGLENPSNSLEVDLEDNFLIDSVSVLNTWCNNSNEPEKCLCDLTGATLTLMNEYGEEITSVSAGDTCELETVEFTFDASFEFCESKVSFNTLVYI